MCVCACTRVCKHKEDLNLVNANRITLVNFTEFVLFALFLFPKTLHNHGTVAAILHSKSIALSSGSFHLLSFRLALLLDLNA